MISMRTKYAIKALTHMARNMGREPFQIGEIAEAENIPKKFLEAILLALKSQGILASRKGPGGGYWLLRKPAEVTLGSVIRTFEGDVAPLPCLAEGGGPGCPDCSDPPTCGTRLVMGDVLTAVTGIVDRVTIADMIERSEYERQKRARQVDFAI